MSLFAFGHWRCVAEESPHRTFHHRQLFSSHSPVWNFHKGAIVNSRQTRCVLDFGENVRVLRNSNTTGSISYTGFFVVVFLLCHFGQTAFFRNIYYMYVGYLLFFGSIQLNTLQLAHQLAHISRRKFVFATNRRPKYTKQKIGRTQRDIWSGGPVCYDYAYAHLFRIIDKNGVTRTEKK